MAASPTAAARTPLPDEVVCDVFSTRELVDVLGFETYSYEYSHQPVGPGEFYYACDLQSDQANHLYLRLTYYPGEEVRLSPAVSGTVEFDEIDENFPDTAEELSLEGVEGQGWAWMYGESNAYVAWRYPDRHVMLVDLTSGKDLSQGQIEGFHSVLASAAARIPEIASGPSRMPEAPTSSPQETDS